MKITMREVLAQEQQELFSPEKFPETAVPSPTWDPRPWWGYDLDEDVLCKITPLGAGGARIEMANTAGETEGFNYVFPDLDGLKGDKLEQALDEYQTEAPRQDWDFETTRDAGVVAREQADWEKLLFYEIGDLREQKEKAGEESSGIEVSLLDLINKSQFKGTIWEDLAKSPGAPAMIVI